MDLKNTQRPSSRKSRSIIPNRFLIGVGVLALGFFIAGNGLQIFKGDHVAATTEAGSKSQLSEEQKLKLLPAGSGPFENIRNFSDLETLFGGKVVFVSASEPTYLMTADGLRFEIGEIPGTDIELSSISTTQLTLRQAKELMVLTLPGESTN